MAQAGYINLTRGRDGTSLMGDTEDQRLAGGMSWKDGRWA